MHKSGNELSLDLYKSGNKLSLDLHKSGNKLSLDLYKSGNKLSLDLHKSGNELSLDLHINESPKWNSSLLDFSYCNGHQVIQFFQTLDQYPHQNMTSVLFSSESCTPTSVYKNNSHQQCHHKAQH